MKKVLYLDVCGTLYDSNTTFDFLTFFLSGRKLKLIKYIRSSSLCKILNKLSLMIFRKDLIRIFAIRMLKGYSKDILKDNAINFITTLKIIQPVIIEVESKKKEIDEVILLSASLDFIVESVCDINKFDSYHSTLLEYKNGICTGRMKRDLLWSKHDIISHSLYHDLHKTFITDNITDYPSSFFVEEFIPVIKKTKTKDCKFWRKKGFDNAIYY